MTTGPAFGGAVLAGGASRRMGTDKALLSIGGATLVEHAARALTDAGADSVMIVGGDGDTFAALGLHPVPDRWPGEGPLGGILTALLATDRDVLVVLPCDLTAPSDTAVRAVTQALGDHDVAVPVVDGREQWMHAAWHRRSIPPLREAFAAGIRAPRAAIGSLAVARFVDGAAGWFHDADRPEDLPG